MAVIPEVTYGPKVAVPVIEVIPTDYKVVTAASNTALATAVKAQMALGWVPLGAVSGVSSSLYAQAMVLY